MLHINDLTYRLGPRLLFDKAGAALPEGARIGFVGRNGTGKTTLFRMIAGELHPETGTLSVPRNMRLGRVEQAAPGGATRTAFDPACKASSRRGRASRTGRSGNVGILI